MGRIAALLGVICVILAACWFFWPGSDGGKQRASRPVQVTIGPENAERGPRFPWVSFMRFWNVWCVTGAEINNPQLVNGRYIVPYGYSVSLVVEMAEGVVHSVSALYAEPVKTPEGGQRWLKLVNSIITVGTYRWPAERVDDVRQRFRAITPEPAVYIWQNSRFQRQKSPQSGWEFTLTFLPVPVFETH